MRDETFDVNPGYAMGQLERAIATARTHADPAVRERAERKIAQWTAVIDGMASGSLAIGTREPIAAPVWATPEVAHGGFATGRLLAEQPVSDAERALTGSGDRSGVNRWFLSDEGLSVLRQALSGGTYRIDVPEQAALPVVAWLLERDAAAALDLVETLLPWFDRLAFAPRLGQPTAPAGPVVRVASAAEVAAAMRSKRAKAQVVAMNATLGVWTPLYERLVALWMDTSVQSDGPVAFPEGWAARRDAWKADFEAAVASGAPRGRHGHPKSNFQRLLAPLHAAPDLPPASAASVRRALANTLARHGAPDSDERVALRAAQAEIARRPTFDRLSRIVADRLAPYGAERGVAQAEDVLGPVGAAEDPEFEGVGMPRHFVACVRRATEAPIEELVALGVIGSGEVLAKVLPQITGQVAAAAIDDPVLRDLFTRLYAAFRRRRSLLLLHLAHQVRLEELPWVAAIARYRSDRVDAASTARLALEQLVALALTAFPETIVPNPLVRELGALAKAAALELPLVEEVAADIFMGTFTEKWQSAAFVASQALEGGIYARYFDLPPPATWGEERTAWRLRWGVATAERFAGACAERAREAQVGSGSRVAVNGTVLEQSQILTTHNLAVLVFGVGLADRLRPFAVEMATRALVWPMLRQLPPDWKQGLRLVKNAAFAWRQGIFFLDLCTPAERAAIVAEVVRRAEERPTGVANRLRPAVRGLQRVLAGERFAGDGRLGADARRFLGWSVGLHWALPAPDDVRAEPR